MTQEPGRIPPHASAPARPAPASSRRQAVPAATAEAIPPPRLIACDIDGTLLDGDGELRPAVRAAVEQILGAGIHVVLATGRSPWNGVRAIADALGLQGPQITMQGALCSIPGTSLLQRVRPLPREVYLEALEVADELGVDPIVASLHGHRVTAGGRWNDETWPWLAAHRELLAVASLRDVADEQPLRVFVPTDPADHELVRAALAGRFAGRASVGRADTSGVELLAHGTSKGEALDWLAGTLGIGLHEVAAIGDAWNDLEMIRAAGRSAALANAPADVLEAADAVFPTSDEDGVVQAFAWLLPHLAPAFGESSHGGPLARADPSDRSVA